MVDVSLSGNICYGYIGQSNVTDSFLASTEKQKVSG